MFKRNHFISVVPWSGLVLALAVALQVGAELEVSNNNGQREAEYPSAKNLYDPVRVMVNEPTAAAAREMYDRVDPEQMYEQQQKYDPERGHNFIAQYNNPAPPRYEDVVQQGSHHQQHHGQQQANGDQLVKRFRSHLRGLGGELRSKTRRGQPEPNHGASVANQHQGAQGQHSAMQDLKGDFMELSHRIKTHPRVVDAQIKVKPRIEKMMARAVPLVNRANSRLSEYKAKAGQKFREHQERKNAQRQQQAGAGMQGGQQGEAPYAPGSVYPSVPAGAELGVDEHNDHHRNQYEPTASHQQYNA